MVRPDLISAKKERKKEEKSKWIKSRWRARLLVDLRMHADHNLTPQVERESRD